MTAYEIEHYLTPGEQKDLYIDWLKRLRDGFYPVFTDGCKKAKNF